MKFHVGMVYYMFKTTIRTKQASYHIALCGFYFSITKHHLIVIRTNNSISNGVLNGN